MKITEVRRKFGTAIAILTAIGLTFASCTADSGDDAPNPTPQTEIKVVEKDNEQKKAVVQPAVTGLSAKAGDGKVVLSWTNPTNEEFASLEVSYTPDGSSSSKKTLSKTATTHTFSSLTNDTEYTFTVKAISSANTTETATVKATPKKLTTKLDAPTNLVVNSITETENGCAINISFTYNGKNIIDGTTTAILEVLHVASYDKNSAVKVEVGENTRTVTISNFHFDLARKYYFRVKLTNTADNILDSDWSGDARFTYTVSGKDTEYLAKCIYVSKAGEHIIDGDRGYAEEEWNIWPKEPGMKHWYAVSSYRLNYEFIYVDEEQKKAYFHATADAGCYIDNDHAYKFGEFIDSSKLEINPETGYWRCK